MSAFKRIPQEIKDQIMLRVKEGVPVAQLSSQHGVSDKSIYAWIAKGSGTNPGTLQLARLKREKDDLLRIVGEMTLKLSRGEKNKNGF
jgi:transposase-like protein